MKKTMDVITLVTNKICYYVNYFSMLTVVLMMLLICIDVVMGNLLNRPIAGMYEICQVILTTLVFSSWAYTQTVHGHIHVVMFISRMPHLLRFICYGLTSFLSAIVMGIGSYAVCLEVVSRYNSGEMTGTLLIPYWPFLIFEAVAFILLTIILLRDAVKTVMALWDKEIAEEIQADWV